MAGRCLGTLGRLLTSEVMERVIREVVPLLCSSDNECRRQGAIEALACKSSLCHYCLIVRSFLFTINLALA